MIGLPPGRRARAAPCSASFFFRLPALAMPGSLLRAQGDSCAPSGAQLPAQNRSERKASELLAILHIQPRARQLRSRTASRPIPPVKEKLVRASGKVAAGKPGAAGQP